MSKHYDWCVIRAQYEFGIRIRDLMQRFGCSRKAVEIHKKVEQWQKPEKMVTVDGRGGDPVAVPLTANEVLERHRRDWQKLRALHDQAVEIARGARTEAALTYAKTVRTLIDGMKIIEAGERAAWAITDALPPLDEISDAELEQAITEASERIARARRDGGGDTPTIH